MYKVFINQRKIIISDHLPCNSNNERAAVLKNHTEDDLKQKLTSFLNNTNEDVLYIIDSKPFNSWDILKKHTVFIEAAGGLVLNPLTEMLFIYRYGCWDLPKGKKDPGESPAKTAVREVIEECGIDDIEIIKPLPSSYHMYKLPSKDWALKQTYWFLMRADDWKNPTPQIEEDISEVEWVKLTEAQNYLQNTYPSIKILVEDYLNTITS